MMVDWVTPEKEFAIYPIAADKIQEYSNNLHVTLNTSPTFTIHAHEDTLVKIKNSILLIATLKKNGAEAQPFFMLKINMVLEPITL